MFDSNLISRGILCALTAAFSLGATAVAGEKYKKGKGINWSINIDGKSTFKNEQINDFEENGFKSKDQNIECKFVFEKSTGEGREPTYSESLTVHCAVDGKYRIEPRSITCMYYPRNDDIPDSENGGFRIDVVGGKSWALYFFCDHKATKKICE
jgi:hypothetical protein